LPRRLDVPPQKRSTFFPTIFAKSSRMFNAPLERLISD
jgi:hypothetical protein